jgi:hypothetical protein
MMRVMGYVTRVEEMRNTYKMSVVKPEGKRPCGRRRRILDDDITMELKETGCEGVYVKWLRMGSAVGLL